MHRACMKSCGLCGSEGAAGGDAAGDGGAEGGAAGAGSAPCVDLNPQCAGWAEVGECARNPQAMERSCPLSCGVCTDGGEIGGGRAAWGEGEAATTVANVLCLDSRPDCVGWAAAGECARNAGVPKACPKSCGRCDDALALAAGSGGGRGGADPAAVIAASASRTSLHGGGGSGGGARGGDRLVDQLDRLQRRMDRVAAHEAYAADDENTEAGGVSEGAEAGDGGGDADGDRDGDAGDDQRGGSASSEGEAENDDGGDGSARAAEGEEEAATFEVGNELVDEVAAAEAELMPASLLPEGQPPGRVVPATRCVDETADCDSWVRPSPLRQLSASAVPAVPPRLPCACRR